MLQLKINIANKNIAIKILNWKCYYNKNIAIKILAKSS